MRNTTVIRVPNELLPKVKADIAKFQQVKQELERKAREEAASQLEKMEVIA
jgi:BMFP domain-containing protein YqiC